MNIGVSIQNEVSMSKITNATFEFLSELKDNNHKNWFTANKSRYEISKAEMGAFAQEVLDLVNQFDVIETPSGAKGLYRIFRDVRFAKDKSPYKSHWAGYLRRAGAERRGGFYFSVSPGNTYISGGFFGPQKEDLLQIRKQIEADAQPLKDALTDTSFLKYFGELLGDKLKTAPKGFDKEHQEIELLRHKSFYVTKKFSDKEVLANNFEEKIADGFQKMLPFFQVMTDYLLTDLNGEPIL